MKVVVDVNFPPSLATALAAGGIEAIHWSAVGDVRAADAEILAWAGSHRHVVVTQDLDYPELLAVTGAATPSVVLVRDADALGEEVSRILLASLRQCGSSLDTGAIVVLDARGRRVRTLPIE